MHFKTLCHFDGFWETCIASSNCSFYSAAVLCILKANELTKAIIITFNFLFSLNLQFSHFSSSPSWWRHTLLLGGDPSKARQLSTTGAVWFINHSHQWHTTLQIFEKPKHVYFHIQFTPPYLSSPVVLCSCRAGRHPSVPIGRAGSCAGMGWSSAERPGEALHQHTAWNSQVWTLNKQKGQGRDKSGLS